MTFWEIFLLVLTGAGTFASILGIFFALYAKQNGKMTRDFIAQENKATRELIEKISQQIERIPEKTVFLLK